MDYLFQLLCFRIGKRRMITTAKSAGVGFGEHQMHWIMKPFYNDHTAYGAILAFFSDHLYWNDLFAKY
jgi:hypothetical protein